MTGPEIRDFAGYDALIAHAESRGVGALAGNFIEIGAFMGVGTAKLAAFAARYGKRVVVVDAFDPALDTTADSDGHRMGDIYVALLGGRSQREIYDEATRPWQNIETLAVDSMRLELQASQTFCLGFIDGNHDPAYVRHDFELVWPRLVPGGLIAFDDYGGTLPQVRQAIDAVLEEYIGRIEDVQLVADTWIIAFRKAM